MARKAKTPAAGDKDAKPETPPAPKVHGPLIVRAKRDGFRRAGIAHSRAPTRHEADTLTAAEYRRILDEPRLTVRPADEEE